MVNVSAKRVIAIDQGTTGTRALSVDISGRIRSTSYASHQQIQPQPGWVEHDPMEIYATQSSTLIEALGKVGIRSDQVAGIGITNQRETTIAWNRETGEALCPAINWQCRRTADFCDALKAEGFDRLDDLPDR